MIVSISFLTADTERNHIKCVDGKFMIRKQKHGLIKSREVTRTFTAKEFINFVRERDPSITLESGERFRAFRGGDPSSEVVETSCIIETHDAEVARLDREREALKEKTIVPDFHGYASWPGSHEEGEDW